jgi:hypothetical protein
MHEDKDCKKGDCYYGTEDPIVVMELAAIRCMLMIW